MAGTATGGQQRLGELGRGLRLPMIAAPMFLVSGPDLVLACCRAGIVGSFPAPNARTAEVLDDWMGRIAAGHAALAAEVAGADLSNAGTPFIVASESLATPNYKDMVTRASLEDLVLTKVFTGAEAYYLRESIAAAGLDPDNLQGKSKMDLSGTQDQVKAWKDIWSAGQGVDDVRRIESVEEIVSRYERGYREACVLPAFGAGAQA